MAEALLASAMAEAALMVAATRRRAPPATSDPGRRHSIDPSHRAESVGICFSLNGSPESDLSPKMTFLDENL